MRLTNSHFIIPVQILLFNRRLKKTDKYACAKDRIKGLFGAISSNSINMKDNMYPFKKNLPLRPGQQPCLAPQYKSKTAVLNKPKFKSDIAWKFCTIIWTKDGSVPSCCCETWLELKAKTGYLKDNCFNISNQYSVFKLSSCWVSCLSLKLVYS